MLVRFLSEAEKELFDSVSFYESKNFGLGTAFLDEIRETIKLISKYPDSGKPINRYARRVLLKRFQFGVIYRIFNDEIVIQAVMHVKRKPNYWIKRIK